MNFFKRKFSFHDEDGEAALEDPSNAAAPSSGAPPSAFSFQAIANKVSSTIRMIRSAADKMDKIAETIKILE
ncbi:hypothetical protein Y032_0230g2968 [Ancylostoma ceylanicum]|uniref:Uncharacterized protein n=1 Tax=Ancylostoma ceylanicum TaxID=53326 RepID=A0A016SG80_9BILA|nr:hypothetical protein Y032_0230g2968 [Ancylostoma ceylanicum]